MGAILSYPDRTLAASLSGGSWLAAMPLNNLKDDTLSVKARSSNDDAASTIILVDMGSAVTTRCVGILSHNISFAGTIRVRGYSDSGYTSMVTGFDTGTQYAYPQTLTAAQASDYPDHWIYCFASDLTARYRKIEIVDTTNIQGYIELARYFDGAATLVPSVSIAYGASLGYESRDVITESLGGTIWGESKTPRRVSQVTFESLVGMEKQTTLIMQKVLGKTGEFLYVMDSSATAIDMILEAYLGMFRSVSPIQYPYFNNQSMPLEIVEKLNSSNVTYLIGGGAAAVKARE